VRSHNQLTLSVSESAKNDNREQKLPGNNKLSNHKFGSIINLAVKTKLMTVLKRQKFCHAKKFGLTPND